MAYSGTHNPRSGVQARPNPDGWVGGPEDFETVWTLTGHRDVSWCDDMTIAEQAKQGRGHQRLHNSPGFGGA